MFWKWLAENHPVIDFLVWLTTVLISLTAIGISIYGIIIK